MPGFTHGFHEGSRSEYLAAYVFSSFGTASTIPHQEDHGFDLYCTLSKRDGPVAWADKPYSVQVKSDHGPWEFKNPKSIEWFIRHPIPLFLCVVDRDRNRLSLYQTTPKAISQKESTYSGCWCWVDQNVVLGQCRMALQAFFNRLHRRLPERNALLVDFVAEFDDRRQPLPGHPLGPLHHGLCIDQFRPIPLQLQDTPAPLDGVIFAVVRRIIQELNWLVNLVGELHHAMQKLRTPATALWAIIHFDLQQTRGGLLVCIQGIPLGSERIHDEVTRFVGAAKGNSQLGAILIDDPTRDVLFLAPHIMVTGLVVAPGDTAARIIADVHRRFTIDAQALDAA